MKEYQNLLFLLMSLIPAFAFSQVQVCTTQPAAGIFLQPSEVPATVLQPGDETLPTIFIDPTKTYQQMDGFGFTLTGGSAQLINQMSPEKRAALLEELFGTKGEQIGISYLRISIGASDLSDRVFSYCDLPEGQTDVELETFSIEPERKDLIPIRIFSNTAVSLANVAFRNTDGQIVLIVLNEGDKAINFKVKTGSRSFIHSLESGAVSTMTW